MVAIKDTCGVFFVLSRVEPSPLFAGLAANFLTNPLNDIFNLPTIFANYCIKSVFLHSLQSLNPSSELFCIVQQNDIKRTKVTPFETVSQFRKFLPSKEVVPFLQEETVEVWDDKVTSNFEYPTAVFSNDCSGSAPLPLLKNISIICSPIWHEFDEENCISLKYLNVSYYLHKYSSGKGQNRSVVALEGDPEGNDLIRWLYWNGTACINAISMVMIKFFVRDGLLEDITASVEYSNITDYNYLHQLYHFDAIFVDLSINSDFQDIQKPVGYDIGQNIRIYIENITNSLFLIPLGTSCEEKNSHGLSVKFGVHISSSCQIKISTCAQISRQIRSLLNHWKTLTIRSLPSGRTSLNLLLLIFFKLIPNLNTSDSQFEYFQRQVDDKSCELITAASIQLSYIRIGNVQAYSHQLISYKIELNKPNLVNLSQYPYNYSLKNYKQNFVLGFLTALSAAILIPSINAAGGIWGLKAITGNAPYLGFGNAWINTPSYSSGTGNLYNLYSPLEYGSNYDYPPLNHYRPYNHYYPYDRYQSYQPYFNRYGPVVQQSPSKTSTKLSISVDKTYYHGRGNPWINKQGE
ncbi:unnamed protein product [Thelazia callipaeda]|uniref:DUF1619 domain-containing protein n=1 Tax=Thelazia callipaeda TaxID=103827 RepID=A0A158RB89_THECL|nr:unnamed protein product [Thelazia callipaeda]